MNYMKLMPHLSIQYASRNKRELAKAEEAGYHVIVVSTDEKAPDDRWEYVYSGIRSLTRDIPRLKRYRVILIDNSKLIRKLRRIKSDVISCHDIRALLIGWLSTRFMPKNTRPKLIYDSHEFEIGRNIGRSKKRTWVVMHLEHFLIKRCAFTIIPCDSSADQIQSVHKLEDRPVVIRSTPDYWRIDETIIRQTRRELLGALGISEDTFIIMYHGALMRSRGIESVIELVEMNPSIAGIILGNGEEEYLSELRALVVEKKVVNRVLFHPAVPIGELWKYVGAADAGMIILKNACANHYNSLPNKLFENIQSLTPIIGSNFPEISRIVNQYGIGLLCDPNDLAAMNACVEKMRTDQAFYRACKTNLIQAKNDLCWEKEKERLADAYKTYLI